MLHIQNSRKNETVADPFSYFISENITWSPLNLANLVLTLLKGANDDVVIQVLAASFMG